MHVVKYIQIPVSSSKECDRMCDLSTSVQMCSFYIRIMVSVSVDFIVTCWAGINYVIVELTANSMWVMYTVYARLWLTNVQIKPLSLPEMAENEAYLDYNGRHSFHPFICCTMRSCSVSRGNLGIPCWWRVAMYGTNIPFQNRIFCATNHYTLGPMICLLFNF